MPEVDEIAKLLKKGKPADPMVVGQGGYGLQQPYNPIQDTANDVGYGLIPEYLKNPNVHGLAPNAEGKTPRSQPDNPIPYLMADIATGGPKSAMFLGPLARTANLAKLADAKKLTSEAARQLLNGYNPLTGKDLPTTSFKEYEKILPGYMRSVDQHIFDQTNWFRRPDSMWRTPIDDSKAYASAIGFEQGKRLGGVPLNKALWHNKMYDAYPEFKDINFKTLPDTANYKAMFDSNGLMYAKNVPNPERTSNLLHEGQHAIQNVEDFAPGSNPDYLKDFGKQILHDKGVPEPFPPEAQSKLNDAAFNLYERHSGEDEPRMVQRLFSMPSELREKVFPGNGTVARSQQVVPNYWLDRQTPDTQEHVKNTMTHQFQGGIPTLENYIKLLKLDAKGLP